MKKLIIALTALLSSVAFSDTLMVEVLATEYGHQVQKTWIVDGDFADKNQPAIEGNLRVTLWVDEFAVQEYVVRNPLHLHSPLLQSGEEAEHDEHELLESLYHLRIPANKGLTRLTVEVIEDGAAVQKQLRSAPVAPVLDFQL